MIADELLLLLLSTGGEIGIPYTPSAALFITAGRCSGTSLIAAEHIERRSRAIEIDPEYCDVVHCAPEVRADCEALLRLASAPP